jgi:type IV secretory pathway TrbD component
MIVGDTEALAPVPRIFFGSPLLIGGFFHHLLAANVLASMIGPVVRTWWLGGYALVFGIALLVLGFKLKAQLNKHPEPSRVLARRFREHFGISPSTYRRSMR